MYLVLLILSHARCPILQKASCSRSHHLLSSDCHTAQQSLCGAGDSAEVLHGDPSGGCSINQGVVAADEPCGRYGEPHLVVNNVDSRVVAPALQHVVHRGNGNTAFAQFHDIDGAAAIASIAADGGGGDACDNSIKGTATVPAVQWLLLKTTS